MLIDALIIGIQHSNILDIIDQGMEISFMFEFHFFIEYFLFPVKHNKSNLYLYYLEIIILLFSYLLIHYLFLHWYISCLPFR